MDAIEIAGLVVHPEVVSHPLLGDAQVIEHAGQPITAMSAINWDYPTQIPTIAEPRRLPAGSGTLLLNAIASRARDARVPTLRYAGPYPTSALFHALARSFYTKATEAEFTANVLDRALRVARNEIPIDFDPKPFERTFTPFGFVDRRANIDRASIAGVLFERRAQPGSLARLAELTAELAFADVTWTKIAKLDHDGALVDGPHAIPALTGDVVGKSFPAPLREQFADLVADAVPAPLAHDARAVVLARPIVWADLGWRAAARDAGGFAVHAGFWTVLAPRGLTPLALAVRDALANVVTTTILDEVTR